MSVNAKSLPLVHGAWIYTPITVRGGCYQLQVQRIRTRPISAKMVYLKTLPEWTNVILIGPSVESYNFMRSVHRNTKDTVTLFVLWPKPLPTSRWHYSNPAPEPFFCCSIPIHYVTFRHDKTSRSRGSLCKSQTVESCRIFRQPHGAR